MDIAERIVGGVAILDLKGRLILSDGELAFRQRVDALIARGQKMFLVNLGDVTYLDSAGVGAVVWNDVTLKTARRDIEAATPSPARTEGLVGHQAPGRARDIRLRDRGPRELSRARLTISPPHRSPDLKVGPNDLGLLPLTSHLSLQGLDEDHLVARLVVDQLVHERARDREAEAPWPEALLLAHERMLHGSSSGLLMAACVQALETEPFAGVGDAIEEHALRAQTRDADLPVGSSFPPHSIALQSSSRKA